MTSPARGSRRDRQLREISTLVAAGAEGRAAGLALEHLACFPQDAALLDDAGVLPIDSTDQPKRSDRASIRPGPPEHLH